MHQTPFDWQNSPTHTHRTTSVHGVSADAPTEVSQDQPDWFKDKLRESMDQSSTVLLSAPTEFGTFSPKTYVPSMATRILRNVAYVFVIITCIALLYTMVETWMFINDVQTTLTEWSKSFNSNLLGD